MPDRLAQIYDMTIAWGARIAPTAARDNVEFLEQPQRVTDLLACTVLTLVRDPGVVESEDDVRAYLTDFVIPAITRPVADPAR